MCFYTEVFTLVNRKPPRVVFQPGRQKMGEYVDYGSSGPREPMV